MNLGCQIHHQGWRCSHLWEGPSAAAESLKGYLPRSSGVWHGLYSEVPPVPCALVWGGSVLETSLLHPTAAFGGSSPELSFSADVPGCMRPLCSAGLRAGLTWCKVPPGLEILHSSLLSVFSNFSSLAGWLPVTPGSAAGRSCRSLKWNSLLLLGCPKTKPEMLCEGESASVLAVPLCCGMEELQGPCPAATQHQLCLHLWVI